MKINFDQQNHVVIKNVLSKDACALLADYAKFQADRKPNIRRKGDPLANIHRAYGDPLMESLLIKFTPIIEQAIGRALWPTLSFYYTYKNGNQLAKHKDRSSCEFVAGLCMGMDAAYKAREGNWPLVLNVNGQPEPISLEEGDLLIFKGHETEHWREVFTGQWFVSAIFAYVDKEGPFAFQKFDQRKRLGAPHVGMIRWSLGCLKQSIRDFYIGVTAG
jgi:hypothetical protein